MAIKKIMKPFSTPVLSKRTYRELKLLKHIQHENVRLVLSLSLPLLFIKSYRSSALATFSFLLLKICQFMYFQRQPLFSLMMQLFCHGAFGYRSPPPTHIQAAREAIYSIFPISNSGGHHPIYFNPSLSNISAT